MFVEVRVTTYRHSHWPNCNWCATGSNGRVHLVHDGNRTDDSGSTSDNGDDDVYQDEAVQSPDEMSEFPVARHRMSRRRRRTDDVIEPSEGPQAPLGALPSTVSLSSLYLSTSPTKTTATAVAGTSAPPQAAAKTSSCTPSPTKPMPPSASKSMPLKRLTKPDLCDSLDYMSICC